MNLFYWYAGGVALFAGLLLSLLILLSRAYTVTFPAAQTAQTQPMEQSE